jgi:hypothetical protein
MNATGFAATKIQPPRARSARIERPALEAALARRCARAASCC